MMSERRNRNQDTFGQSRKIATMAVTKKMEEKDIRYAFQRFYAHYAGDVPVDRIVPILNQRPVDDVLKWFVADFEDWIKTVTNKEDRHLKDVARRIFLYLTGKERGVPIECRADWVAFVKPHITSMNDTTIHKCVSLTIRFLGKFCDERKIANPVFSSFEKTRVLLQKEHKAFQAFLDNRPRSARDDTSEVNKVRKIVALTVFPPPAPLPEASSPSSSPSSSSPSSSSGGDDDDDSDYSVEEDDDSDVTESDSEEEEEEDIAEDIIEQEEVEVVQEVATKENKAAEQEGEDVSEKEKDGEEEEGEDEEREDEEAPTQGAKKTSNRRAPLVLGIRPDWVAFVKPHFKMSETTVRKIVNSTIRLIGTFCDEQGISHPFSSLNDVRQMLLKHGQSFLSFLDEQLERNEMSDDEPQCKHNKKSEIIKMHRLVTLTVTLTSFREMKEVGEIVEAPPQQKAPQQKQVPQQKAAGVHPPLQKEQKEQREQKEPEQHDIEGAVTGKKRSLDQVFSELANMAQCGLRTYTSWAAKVDDDKRRAMGEFETAVESGDVAQVSAQCDALKQIVQREVPNSCFRVLDQMASTIQEIKK
jgi:hypothetical protein